MLVLIIWQEHKARTKVQLLTTDDTPHPLHLIDKYSRNKKAARWLTIEFKTQYTDANGDVQIDTD